MTFSVSGLVSVRRASEALASSPQSPPGPVERPATIMERRPDDELSASEINGHLKVV
jgi:hypothetical protein